jgi:tetratricopeptide (TPR) repeat protein
MKKVFTIIILLISFHFFSFSQDQFLIDSLNVLLKAAKQDTARANILYQISVAYWDYDTDKAIDYANQTLALSEKTGYKKGIGNSYHSMGVVYESIGDYSTAIDFFLKALKICEETGDKKGMARTNLSYGQILLGQGKYTEAINTFTKSMNLYNETGNKNGVANTYLFLGDVYFNQGNYPEALKNYSLSKAITLEIDDHKVLTMVYRSIGNIYQVTGNIPEALKNYNNSLRIAEKIHDKYTQANLFNDIGSLYMSRSEYAEALKSFENSLELEKEIGNNIGVAISLHNIAGVYCEQRNYPQALKNYSAALNIFKETGFQRGIAATFTNIGLINEYQHNYPEAIRNYFSGLRIYEEIGQRTGIASSKRDIGSVFLLQHKYSDASEYLYEALSIAIETGDMNEKKLSYKFLAKLDSAQGNFRQALEHYKLYIAASDSLMDEENTKKLVQHQMQYEFDKKEALAKAEQEKKDALAQKELQVTRIVFAGTGGFMIIILLIIILLVQRKRYQSDRKALVLEQKLLRSQMNPHFIFNSLASIQNFIVNQKANEASIYLSRFSQLVRNILDNSIEEYVPVQKEIETIQHYLELQQIRYAGQFTYDLTVDERIDGEGMMIPPMLAQPFIENSIEHGIRYKETTGHIDIRFRLEGGLIRFEVEDDGVGRERAREIEVKQNRTHRSLSTSITRERLAKLNKKLKAKIHMEITDLKNDLGEACGTRVTFGIPVVER